MSGGNDLATPDSEAPGRVSLRRRLRRIYRRLVKWPLLWLGLFIGPLIYLVYLRLVWATSRIEDETQPVHEIRDRHDGVVCLLWHEEVFSVAWAYRDFHPHTLASVGDAGEAIARLLNRCGYTVFRGGSARKESRRRTEVLADMIEHMKTTPRVLYGLTVDGSTGPRYHLKRGGLVIARECRKPVLAVRSWAKWNIRLPTWDRMAIPLPFNRIRRTFSGPFFVPEDAGDPEKFELFRRKIEREISKLAEESYRHFGQKVPECLYTDYGEG